MIIHQNVCPFNIVHVVVHFEGVWCGDLETHFRSMFYIVSNKRNTVVRMTEEKVRPNSQFK